jgi:nitrate reductase delta subunit
MARIFKALSALLTYPTQALKEAAGAIGEAVEEEALPAEIKEGLRCLVDEIASGDLYDLQERYVLLFDRTRSLSLHLFEHVYGESRDRGQAMVDLQSLYARHGLALKGDELPDYLPLFLEFLATQPRDQAHALLSEPAHILTALAERLDKREAPYAFVFRALTALAATKPKDDEVTALLAEPDADASDLCALDAAWEDAPVVFGPGSGNACRDDLAIRLRAARRPVEGAPAPSGPRTTITVGSRRSQHS